MRLRHCAELVRGIGFAPEEQGLTEGDLPFFKVADLGRPGNETALVTCENWISQATATRLRARPVPAGSVLMPKIGAAMMLGARRITTRLTVFDNNLLAIVPTRIEARYLRYWLSVTDVRPLANPGPVPSLDDDALRNLVVPVAATKSQRNVADYLDRETVRIDILIAVKRRMAELVTDWFDSMIYAAVTGRLEPPRPMKQSPLDWVSEVPASWGFPPVSANFSVELGKMLSPEEARGPDQRPYLRNTNVQWNRFDLGDLATMHFTSAERQRFALQDGDLLVCEGGEVGRAAIWSGQLNECYYQKALHRLRPMTDVNSRYLLYCLWTAARQRVFEVEGNLSTIVHLTREQLRVHRFPWPPRDEQDRIVRRLDACLSVQDSLSDLLDRQLSQLAERREALIRAAVTGTLGAQVVAV